MRYAPPRQIEQRSTLAHATTSSSARSWQRQCDALGVRSVAAGVDDARKLARLRVRMAVL
jgi:hypothetical protein